MRVFSLSNCKQYLYKTSSLSLRLMCIISFQLKVFIRKKCSWLWWCMQAGRICWRRQRQEDREFKVSLGYTFKKINLCLFSHWRNAAWILVNRLISGLWKHEPPATHTIFTQLLCRVACYLFCIRQGSHFSIPHSNQHIAQNTVELRTPACLE